MNKMIKRLLGITLSLSMILGMGTVAFADFTVDDETGHHVFATYEEWWNYCQNEYHSNELQQNVDGTYTVHTNMPCTVWKAPQTTDEYRGKKVSEGYTLTVYPYVYKSKLNDGKTFYKTAKGSYVLCKCVKEDIPAYKNDIVVTENDFKNLGTIIRQNHSYKSFVNLLVGKSVYEPILCKKDKLNGFVGEYYTYIMICPTYDEAHLKSEMQGRMFLEQYVRQVVIPSLGNVNAEVITSNISANISNNFSVVATQFHIW